jgi:hypothetical protein
VTARQLSSDAEEYPQEQQKKRPTAEPNYSDNQLLQTIETAQRLPSKPFSNSMRRPRLRKRARSHFASSFASC